MTDLPVILLSELLGTRIAEDGEHMLLDFDRPEGAVAVAVPYDFFHTIIAALFWGYGELQENRGERALPALGTAYAAVSYGVERIQIGQVENQTELFLSLIIAKGPRLHLQLLGDTAELLCDALDTALYQGRNDEPPSLVN